MRITINLIRHGKTAGNLLGRYIGSTDEELCAEGISELKRQCVPEADHWFVSPMRRCIQTAGIMYEQQNRIDPPGFDRRIPMTIVDELRECDFGIFENRNYLELGDCPEYQTWIDSGGTLPFPGGEAPEEFKERSCRAFETVLRMAEEMQAGRINLIVHGGTIMSIMERYVQPGRSYYEWHVKNGAGYRLFFDDACFDSYEIIELYDGSRVKAASESADRCIETGDSGEKKGI